jgi:hypothetical protein
LRSGIGRSKQVTFASHSSSIEQQQQQFAAGWLQRQQSVGGGVRLSLDAATAAGYHVGWQGQLAAATVEERQLLMTAGAAGYRSLQFRPGSRSGSNLGHASDSWQSAAAAAVAAGSEGDWQQQQQQQGVHASSSSVWQQLESAGQLSRSYDAGFSGAKIVAGVMDELDIAGVSRLGAGGGATAVTGGFAVFEGPAVAAAVAARLHRRNSWG